MFADVTLGKMNYNPNPDSRNRFYVLMDLQSHVAELWVQGQKKICGQLYILPQCVLWSHIFISLPHVFTFIPGCQNSPLIIALKFESRVLWFVSCANLDVAQRWVLVIQNLMKQKEKLFSLQSQYTVVVRGRMIPIDASTPTRGTSLSLVHNNFEILKGKCCQFFRFWSQKMSVIKV